MELEVSVLYSLSLDAGQCVEKKIQSDISEFERLVGVNKNESLRLLGDIEACIDILKWIEKGFLVSAIVLNKHEYKFSVDDLEKKALELNNKLHMLIYSIKKNHGTHIFGLLIAFLATRKDIYGEENIKIYFNSMINSFKDQNK